MAAQVEVQTGEVGRTVAGGRLHLSPLTDSSNKSPIEIPSINQSHIITPEPNKPVPGPKPRLTPKPFAVDKNPTIKPILAPKPQTKPRPESTRLAGYKPELPSSPKPQQPVATLKPRPVSTNPNRPSPTSFKTSNKLNTGQTTKPVVQPFKPAPPLDPGDPSKPTPPVPAERQKPGASSLGYSKSLKKAPAAEWSGTTKKEDDKDKMTSSTGGASITRAKSMGFLLEVGQEEEEKEKAKPETAVPLRPQPRGSRPRPVSAIFLDSPTKTEAPVPAPRWVARRPLSADLTSKFESIGLSLHYKSPKTNSKENTPEDMPLPQKKEQEKTPKSTTSQSTDGVTERALSDQSNKKTEEMTAKEIDEDKRGVSIKSRISLLLDSSSTPGTVAPGQGSDLHSPVQLVPENEPAVDVKQLIKQLTEDTPPTQSPVMKPALKPRPLPLDLTKRFSSERSPDLGSVSLIETTDHHEISKDPQRRNEELALTPSDHRTFVDLKDSQEQLQKASTPEGPEGGQTFGATTKESCASGEVQTVRASLFENVVERHSVLMVDEAKPVNKPKDSLSSPSVKRGNSEDEGTLVTATYKEPLSPSSPMRVLHAFDTVQAIEENRAVSENVPSAQWEDKAMTLRSRRSEGSRPVAERTGSAQAEPALVAPEQQPRYLRVGALQKWNNTGIDQDAGVEKGMLKEPQREGQVAVDEDRQREQEQEEVAAAPKRLKMLQPEDQQKPRATYFALTGQIQEPSSPVDAGANMRDMTVPFDNFTVRSALGGSQGKILPVRRNPSLEEAFGKTSQDQIEELMMGSHMPHREISSALDGQATEEMMEVEKKKELRKETEKHKAKIKELEKQRQLEMEKAHLEFARMKERDLQREFERQRQIAFDKEKQEFEKKQRALERQKQIELEKQKQHELEREKQRELEREKQRQLEKEKRRELDRQREIERAQVREQEKEREREQERQRQREEERQRELDKERQLLEIQKEKRKMEALERIKELERQQLLEFQKQKQREMERQQIIELEKQRLREKMEREEAEKIKQMALEHEMLRLKEIDRERERQKEMEKELQKEMEREKQRELERQRQLDIERQELENQRLRQRELEKERQRKEEMERRRLLELEKQRQAERQQILEFEKRRLSEKIEREEAEKMRQIAKQQEAERQRLKEKQERARLEASSLRPKVVDLDSVLRNDPFPKAASQRSDPATRWKEPSLRAEESYKPAILDIDAFSSQTQLSSSKDLFPVPSIQGVDTGFGARSQSTPERDISWKVPPQSSVGFSSPVWTTSPQDPWELRPVEMSVDTAVAEPRKHSNKVSPEQLLLRQEERFLAPQGRWSALLDEPLHLAPFPGTESKAGGSPGGVSSITPAEPIWFPREPQPPESRIEARSHRRSQGSQELNRMRSRSVSRRSTPSSSAVEGSLSRMRSRSAHRERDRHSWVQQKQSVSGEEEGNDSETPVRETDSQYGTWETGLRTDDSLTPATPSSESNISPSPRKKTPPYTPGDRASQFETDTLDGLVSPSSSDSQPLSFPDAPTTLLDTSALRSRAQLGKKRAPRSRPSRAARQSAALLEGEGGTTEDWLYRDSTEAKVESKDDDSDSEEQARGADAHPAVASPPQRVALFPGMDPSALKAQLKKRGDSDNQTDGPTPSPSQLSRSPKSPFLPRAARVLPPPGGKENGEEDSPQWLKELKSKKRLSQYESES
ncbi:trichohyalin isoform X1 [Seriola aureovittata]|uniref:trichohyalin isoform X1 n=1 Tax=Seriola aureovittata TaxID=2871759 RepID=UPI0024BECB13|nr:trichohyalin isoform X1 [Seriola aureovittata]